MLFLYSEVEKEEIMDMNNISRCANFFKKEDTIMNLALWLPGMFLLGIAAMGLCLLFLKACEKI